MENWVDACLICGKAFSSEQEMAEHVRSHNDKHDGQPPTTEKKLQKSQCPFCPYEGGVNEIEIHLMAKHAQDIKTPEKDTKIGPTSSSAMPKVIDPTGSDQNQVEDKTSIAVCPICGESNFSSTDALNLHVNTHFSEANSNEDLPHSSNDELLAIRIQQQEEYEQFRKSQKAAEEFHFERLKDQYGMSEKHSNTGFKKQALKNMGKSVGRNMSTFEYYNNKLEMLEKLEKGIDDGMTTSSAVFGHLITHLENTLKQNERAWFSSATDFIGRGPGDSGWGCGYRNIQMLISNLNQNPNFSRELSQRFHGDIPSIPKIQEMMELAWGEGYDARGREQLKGKVVNTRKWIGATEAFSFFASLKMHCRIVDFVRPSGPNNTHPLLFQWVADYFQSLPASGKVTVTDKPPLYLQHEGHSRSVVGVICRNSTSGPAGSGTLRLILFDPGIPLSATWRKESGRKLSSTSPYNTSLCAQKFIKPVSSLTKRQYQIVPVVGWASEQRTHEQKNVDAMCEKVQ